MINASELSYKTFTLKNYSHTTITHLPSFSSVRYGGIYYLDEEEALLTLEARVKLQTT